MIYRDLSGAEHTGEVWSAGPVANTAWVRSTAGEWAVVSIKTKTQIEYHSPALGPPMRPEIVQWADEVIKSRRHNPLPDGWLSCDPELEIAQMLWARAIELDQLSLAIKATRWADRQSVSAKRLLSLEEE